LLLGGGDGEAMDLVEVYDLATGKWTDVRIGAPDGNPIAASAGSEGLFLQESALLRARHTQFELFTDPAAVTQLRLAAGRPPLVGKVKAGAKSKLLVTVNNAGPGAAAVGIWVYAVPTGADASAPSILLGSAPAKRALRAGTVVQKRITLTVPGSLPGGEYRVVVVAGDGAGQQTLSYRKTFVVGTKGSAAAIGDRLLNWLRK
jgi:hypothetical protein